MPSCSPARSPAASAWAALAGSDACMLLTHTAAMSGQCSRATHRGPNKCCTACMHACSNISCVAVVLWLCSRVLVGRAERCSVGRAHGRERHHSAGGQHGCWIRGGKPPGAAPSPPASAAGPSHPKNTTQCLPALPLCAATAWHPIGLSNLLPIVHYDPTRTSPQAGHSVLNIAFCQTERWDGACPKQP